MFSGDVSLLGRFHKVHQTNSMEMLPYLLYQLWPAPETIDTICCYITYLSEQVCYNTICNYISAVWSLHDIIDCHSPARGSFLVKCSLRGACRLLGDSVLSAEPLYPEQLLLIYRSLDHKDITDLTFWSAICLAFRCLLT